MAGRRNLVVQEGAHRAARSSATTGSRLLFLCRGHRPSGPRPRHVVTESTGCRAMRRLRPRAVAMLPRQCPNGSRAGFHSAA